MRCQESALLKRGCVNECCGCEVGMLWLSLAFSPQLVSACLWGAMACFSVAGMAEATGGVV